MSMPWLFGPTHSDDYRHDLQPRSLDIDVVIDVYRALALYHEADLRRPVGSEYTLPAQRAARGEAWTQDEYNFMANMRDARAPRVELVFPDPVERGEFVKEVDIDHVLGLNSYERAHLVVVGAGVTAWFVRDRAASVMIDSGITYPEDRLGRIAEQIKQAGPRRVHARRAIRFIPYIVAAVGTVAGVWTAIEGGFGAAAIVLLLVVLAAVWVAASKAHRDIANRYQYAHSGHRFREVSRAAVRERMTNGIAAAIWAGITAIITIPGTWILSRLFG